MKCNITLNEQQKESSLGYELFPTPERVVPDTFEVNINKEQLLNLISNNIPIDGFRGGFITSNEMIDSFVPEGLPFRSFVDDNGITVIKTFREYSNVISSGDTHFIVLGYRDVNGNRSNVVSSEEFYSWVNHFGTEGLLTWEEAIALRSQLEPSEDI